MIADIAARPYDPKLDEAKTPEDEYCAFVHRERWLRPYDNNTIDF